MASELEVGGVSSTTAKLGSSAGSAHGDADDLIIGNGSSTNAGITFNTPSAGGYLYFADGSSGDDLYRGFIKYVHSGNAMEFGTNAVSRLSISSTGLASFSNGIAFPTPDPASAGTPAASSVLNVYEEGTFTPTISAETGTINGTNIEGRYTRIGNVCHVWFTIECTGVSGASNSVNFGGFPFTSSSIASGFNTPMVVRYVSLGSAVESLVLRLFNNSTGGRIEEQTGTSTGNLADNVQNGTIFQVAGSYRV